MMYQNTPPKWRQTTRNPPAFLLSIQLRPGTGSGAALGPDWPLLHCRRSDQLRHFQVTFADRLYQNHGYYLIIIPATVSSNMACSNIYQVDVFPHSHLWWQMLGYDRMQASVQIMAHRFYPTDFIIFGFVKVDLTIKRVVEPTQPGDLVARQRWKEHGSKYGEYARTFLHLTTIFLWNKTNWDLKICSQTHVKQEVFTTISRPCQACEFVAKWSGHPIPFHGLPSFSSRNSCASGLPPF
jgi:hypothetical protein